MIVKYINHQSETLLKDKNIKNKFIDNFPKMYYNIGINIICEKFAKYRSIF